MEETPLTDSKIKRAGENLYQEFISRSEFSIMTSVDAPSTIDESYAVQDVYMDLKAADSGGFAGYKIAYTTKVMQQRLGAKEPVYGRVLSDTVFNSPVALASADYVRIGVECEVAVFVSKDMSISDSPFDKDSVYESLGDIALAFEIIDGRSSAGEPTVPQSIATNISGAGIVLGKPVHNWRDLDIPSAKCELFINQESVGAGKGSDVNGHPVEPMTWIANSLASRGKSLKAGDIVITGSMIPPVFLDRGVTALVEMDHLGSVALHVE